MSDSDLRPTCEHHHEEGGGHDHHGPGRAELRASRRAFIKGVIASGVAVSSAGYLVLGRLRMRRAAAEHQIAGRRHRHARGDHAFDESAPRGAQLGAVRTMTRMVMASSFFVMMFASRT